MSARGSETYGGHVLRSVLAPWRRSLWWDLTHLTTDLVVGTVSFTVVVTLAATAIGLLITFPLAIPVVWALFLAGRAIGRIERSRARALLAVEIDDPVRPLTPGSWWAHWKARFRDGARWRELAHGLLLLPLGVLNTVAVVTFWGGSAALVALPLYVGSLPGGSAKFWLFDVEPGAAAVGLALVGVIGLVLVSPWVTHWLARLDAAEARWLLGPRNRSQLEQRVSELETSREAAVDSAEAERRRIERDLHDGAQQRLVALAVSLGEARQQLDADPDSDAGRELVARSHDEAKAALQEIRDLVRGIHPVILEDRGLDAALSAVVARSPVPVQVEVSLTERLPAPIESAAYFTVTEALTNVARHAGATHAWVTVARVNDRLLVEVRDDGHGGADEATGTGLAGLRSRATSLGGWMHVVSPAGGPTTLTVELPCAS
jgi:signal transduction histidine kinase